MATQAIDKDYSNWVAGGRVGALAIDGLVATPAEVRYAANGMACSGCTVNCPRLAGRCGSRAPEAIARRPICDFLADGVRA